MRTHKENFEMYMEVPIKDYCENVIEAIDREIEELGIRALTDLLISPAGYGLEVINLHDNPGSHVDVMPYAEPDKSSFRGAFSASNPPIVRLFFYPYVVLSVPELHLRGTADLPGLITISYTKDRPRTMQRLRPVRQPDNSKQHAKI